MNTRKWWIAATAGVALATIVGLGAVAFAQEATPGAAGTTLLDRVAQKLGIESSTLRDAVTSSANDQIDERLANCELTQAQADAIKERIANAPDDSLLGLGRHGDRGPGGFGFERFADDELTTFLGVSEDELRSQLQADGATLASVAGAHGKSRDELKAFLTDQLKAHLAERVASGDITQAEADSMVADASVGLDAMIDGAMPFEGPHGGPRVGVFGAKPQSTSAASSTDTNIN